ncbi:MAG TPA: prepilin-type N-terminal cleavage/methylation domain-containing protein [Planctomycetota bacterium]|nr:prepilin-type N-terminal cleavage/methylation domain-containing protein [Planctomycetota bacterium]
MRQERGFTLIEVLVALVVAVAAMSLLSQGFTTAARASTASQYATRAAILGQRVVTDFETGTLSLTSSQGGKFDDDSDFTYETKTESTDITGLTKLTITIHWQERNVDTSYVLVRLMRSSSGTTTPSSSGSTTTPTTTPNK